MRPEAGVVALESLLVLPLVAMLVAVVLATTTVAADHLSVARAARAAARSVALTGEAGTARTVVQAVHPRASVAVTIRRGVVHVTVATRSRLVGVPFRVDAAASAPLEPVTAPR